jgi:nucleotide-binding universal stress UspA family protein
MFRKILLPLDGSTLGEAALPYVEELAQLGKIEVILFQSIATPHDVQLAESYTSHLVHLADEYIAHASAAARDYLNTVRKRLAEKGIIACADVEVGHPAEKIIEYAKKKDVDLIAMSTHGRSGVSRLFGSVADKVAHHSEKPVLLIRPPMAETT